jgi:hypothetical protein
MTTALTPAPLAPSVQRRAFAPVDFFVVRSASLPVEVFEEWGKGLQVPHTTDDSVLEHAIAHDRALLRERLREIALRPDVREALYLASPDLEGSLEDWVAAPETARGIRVERALVRYLTRMTTRSTPFGLFAGIALVAPGPETILRLDARNRHRRHTRLDMDFVSRLVGDLERQAGAIERLSLWPNSSLYEAAGRFHFAAVRTDLGDRHSAMSVDATDALRKVLDRASNGALLADLTTLLEDEETTKAEAEEFVHDLIDAQILVSDLRPAVTGPEPLGGLVSVVGQQLGDEATASTLLRVQSDLAALDAPGTPNEPARYRALATTLRALNAAAVDSHLFQVDMIKSARRATLGGGVLEEIERGVEVLHRIAVVPEEAAFSRFIQAFRIVTATVRFR